MTAPPSLEWDDPSAASLAGVPADQAAASRRSAGHARALTLASAIVAATYFGSRVLGALRTTAIAHAFGTPPELDAYYIGNRIPDLLFQVIAGATLASAFIPTFARVRSRRGEDAAWRLASAALNLVTVATALLAVVAFLLAPKLVPLTAPGLGDSVGRGPEMRALAVKLTRLMLAAPIIFAMSGMVSGILNARRRFFLSGVAPMLYNLGIIAGAILYGIVGGSARSGVTLLAVATVAGAGGHLLVQVPGLARVGMRYVPTLGLRDPAVREVVTLMLPRMLGLAAVQLNFAVSNFFASQMAAGTVSSLSYAWSLVVLPLALVGQAISTAVFPHMADQAAEDDDHHQELRNTLAQALRIIVFLTIPATAGLVVLRVPVTSLLLQHGSFTAHDTGVVATALLFYSLGLAAQALIEILSRGFYALRDTRTPVAFAVLSMALNLGFSLLLRGPLGYRGLALALSLAVMVESASLFLVLRARIGGLQERALLWTAARSLVAAWLMAVAVAAAMVWARHTGLFADRRGVRYLFEAAVGIPIGAAVFFAAAALTGSEEMWALLRPLWRRLLPSPSSRA